MRPEIAAAWKKLYREAQVLLKEDHEQKARNPATRWCRLSEFFTGGNSGIESGMKKTASTGHYGYGSTPRNRGCWRFLHGSAKPSTNSVGLRGLDHP
jgi:hypothetical protein